MGQDLLVITITHRHTTLGRTPLDEWSAWRRDLYLTTLNTHKTQTSRPPAVFEPTIPASKRPQSHALDRVATGIGCITRSTTFIYTRESSLKTNSNTLESDRPPRRLCYRPAVFFHLLCLIVFSFPQGEMATRVLKTLFQFFVSLK